MNEAKPMEFLYNNSLIFKTEIPKIDTDFVKPEELYQVHPYKTMGKLFIRTPRGSGYCSATSTGNNAIVTAAHVIYFKTNYSSV